MSKLNPRKTIAWFQKAFHISKNLIIIKFRKKESTHNIQEAYNLHDVFGISNEVSVIYTHRSYVDDEFKKALKRRKHVVIYGCSKQGKTSLRKKHLEAKNSIIIQCTNSTSREKIYELILKEIGIELSISKTESYAGTNKVDVSLSGEGNIFLAKAKTETKKSIENSKTETVTRNHFSIDPTDINDIIRVLTVAKTKKWIVLEDFHYLEDEVQLSLSSDLKVIYEKTNSIRVVIIGVWLASGKLTKLNGDLDGRISYINADVWKEKELLHVISEGEKLLNVFFSTVTKDKIILYCKNNVGLLHQIVEKICDEVGITKTQSKSLLLLDTSEIKSIPHLLSHFKTMESLNKDVDEHKLLLGNFGVGNPNKFETFNYHGGSIDLWLGELSRDKSPRYSNFLRDFANGPEKHSGNIHRFIISALIRASYKELLNGVTIEYICQSIERFFTIKIPRNELRQALNSIRDFHIELKVQPPILDFDPTEDTLKIVDSGLLLYHSTHSIKQMLAIVDSNLLKDYKHG